MKPKPQPYALDAFVAPGHLFFCRRIELAEGLQPGEELEFLALELEKLSPFPLEHMFYGYRLDAARRHAFAFASYRRRFEPGETAGWLKRDAALPDFLVALGEEAADGRPLILATSTSLVGLRYDSRSSLPCDFVAEPREAVAEGEAEDLEAEVAAFSSRWESRLGGEPRVWRASPNSHWFGSNLIVAAEDLGGAPGVSARFSRDAVWLADLRDPETLDRARSIARSNATLWKGVMGVAAVAALMALGELVHGGALLWLNQREAKVESREPLVLSIGERQSAVNELQSFVESNLVPFQMIAELEPYRDARNVVYRKFETVGPDVLEIDAWATNQTQATDFKRRVERFSKVVSVEIRPTSTDSSGSTFIATVRFKPGAFADQPQIASHE